MKEKKFERLSLEEWQLLFVMKGRGVKIREISRILRRDRRALERALKRYPLPWHRKERGPYDEARYAYERALEERSKSRQKQRLKNNIIREYVELKLKSGWSPELISGRIERDHPGQSISHEAIYEWIFEERPDLKKYLLRAGKPKRGKPGARAYPQRQPSAPKKSIELRPVQANERSRVGDNESDLIVSNKSDACLLVVVDRRLRRLRLRKLKNRQSETVRAALVAILLMVPKALRHTLTQDNGSEHALHAELERVTGISVYFCHPYSAWERGTVENRNGVIRRFFPKGTDFALISDDDVAQVEQTINSTPMAVLNFMTPEEAYEQELLKLTA
jgi:IS30 family transposase